MNDTRILNFAFHLEVFTGLFDDCLWFLDTFILDFKGFTVGSCSELEEMIYGCISLQDFCEDLQAAVEDETINRKEIAEQLLAICKYEY